MNKKLTLGASTATGRTETQNIPVIVTRNDIERHGLPIPTEKDFNDMRYVGEDLVRSTDSMKRLTQWLNKAQDRFNRGLPIFREAAAFREETGYAFRGMQPPDWYSELVEDRRYQAVIASSGAGPYADLHSVIMTWMVLKLRGVSDTSNWFRPTDALTHKLLATDLKGTVVADLHLPMDAFYIELPAGVFYIEDPRTGWHEVRVLTVARGRITQRTIDIARAAGDHTADESAISERLLIECYGEPNPNSRDPFDDSWIFMSYVLRAPEMSIEEVIESSVRNREMEKMNRGRCGDHVMRGVELREFLLKFVLNLCIYLGSDKAKVEHTHADEIKRLQGDKKWKHLRKNVQERIQRLKDERIFEVGTDVKVDAEVREYVRRGGVGGYSQTYRTLVRGHWRNQAHGTGWKQRTRKWIEPHVRGVDLPTKVVGHNYKVK
jgi:hypothetical protein